MLFGPLFIGPGTTSMAVLLTITLTGFATTIAQVLMLRELLVRFSGNELSTGLVLACWLIWNALGCGLASKYTARKPPGPFSPGFLLLLATIGLPVSVLIIRASGIIWGLAPGEITSLWPMIQICILGTGLFSPFSGALFSLCWTVYRNLPVQGGPRRPLFVFMGEGLGAAAGGLFFYFVLIGHFSAMTTVWISSGVTLLVSAWWMRPWRLLKDGMIPRFTWIAIMLLFCCGIGFGNRLETMSRQWQWGAHVVAVQDTAYHNVALTREANQYSFFANGLWLFSTPDLPGWEHAVHPALLQHPAPKTVLLLGGSIAGLVEEIRKHPGIQRIDYVDPDPDLIRFAKRHLPPETDLYLTTPLLHVIHQDIGAFLRSGTSRFDIILMSMGDPVNAGQNRFYTEEFFTGIKKRLSSDGVFSFAVSGGQDMLGAVQLRYLRSVYRTLTGVFPEISLYPGDSFRFLATNGAGRLVRSPDGLMRRIHDRNLSLRYVRPDTLEDRMNPLRLDYFQSLLEAESSIRPNRDFSPTCYREALILWSAQWHPLLRETIQWMVKDRPFRPWGLLAAVGGMLLLIPAKRGFHVNPAVAGSVLVAGGATMVLQMVLLLAFQILEGVLYLQLALILSFYMAGLAAGAGWISIRVKSPPTVRRLSRVQALIGLYPLFLIAILFLLHGKGHSAVSSIVLTWLFPAMSFIAGALGGALFSLAVKVLSETGFALEGTGGRLYALDLTGAAVGLLLATCWLLPVYGLILALLWISGVTMVGLIPFFFLKK